jgi:hypothetical protein
VLGSPDPLTIIFVLMVCISQSKMIIVYSTLGALTHFHIMAIAILALAPIYLLKGLPTKINIRQLCYMLLGLFIAKLILICWNIIFLYDVFDRTDFVRDKGLQFFLQRLFEAPFNFFYTPGPYLLFASLIIMFVFIYKKSYLRFLAYSWVLLIGYCAHFLTIDGLRIFTSVTIGGFFLAVTYCLNLIFSKNNLN